jgi:hypothetical protein
MSHDARRLTSRKACAPYDGLHVVMSPSPAARATCRCGWWQAGIGRARARAVIAAYEAHRRVCDGQSVTCVFEGAA